MGLHQQREDAAIEEVDHHRQGQGEDGVPALDLGGVFAGRGVRRGGYGRPAGVSRGPRGDGCIVACFCPRIHERILPDEIAFACPSSRRDRASPAPGDWLRS